ncbi:MAG: YeeE/YedE family protein [Rhodobacteraceae bacterium]|nr:YeeE/YedE family protein [Paracoccaceae bacterium]
MLDIWRDLIIENPAFYIGWGGLSIGTVFGMIVYYTNFCTMGSISDFMNFGDFSRFRSWMLAGLTAIIGVFILQKMQIIEPRNAMYLTTNFGWLGNIIGGLLFGIGMVLSGGCVSRNLVRAGGGDLRSLLLLFVIGVFAFMTIGGILGPLRVDWFAIGTVNLADSGMESQSVGAFLARFTGMDLARAESIALWLIVAAMAAYIFSSKHFLKSPALLFAGFGIGLCVIAGWMLTGLAQDDFADVPVALASLTYVRPTGDTIDYLMRFTAFEYASFGVVTTFGALLGGFIGAALKKDLRIKTFANNADTVRNIFGAAIMGIGGVLALGCTLGQAVTGVSTLALGSFITFACIVLGGMIAMKVMERLA